MSNDREGFAKLAVMFFLVLLPAMSLYQQREEVQEAPTRLFTSEWFLVIRAEVEPLTVPSGSTLRKAAEWARVYADTLTAAEHFFAEGAYRITREGLMILIQDIPRNATPLFVSLKAREVPSLDRLRKLCEDSLRKRLDTGERYRPIPHLTARGLTTDTEVTFGFSNGQLVVAARKTRV